MIKVLGIGSPFGVDSVGWQVVELLLQSNRLTGYESQHLQMEWHDRPGIRLLTLMADASHVLMIDAVVSGHPIGTIHRLENQAIEALPNLLSTHDMGVAEVLQLGRALNQLPQHLVLYGMEVDMMRHNEYCGRKDQTTGIPIEPYLNDYFMPNMLKMKTQIENELVLLLDKNQSSDDCDYF